MNQRFLNILAKFLKNEVFIGYVRDGEFYEN